MLTNSKLVAPKKAKFSAEEQEQNKKIQNYYKLQSKIYDLSRWSFLFGRKSIVKQLPLDRDAKATILEVGCGTGQNLSQIAKRFRNAKLYGIDVSKDMIDISRKKVKSFGDRVELIQAPYQKDMHYPFEQLDGIVFSYSLSMINPQWEDLLKRAYEDLRPGGWIAVVDFHNSSWKGFKNHMSNHHVRMDGHLLNYLRDNYMIHLESVKQAYAGAWAYFLFVGKKL